jgi:hypothetical protein
MFYDDKTPCEPDGGYRRALESLDSWLAARVNDPNISDDEMVGLAMARNRIAYEVYCRGLDPIGDDRERK